MITKLTSDILDKILSEVSTDNNMNKIHSKLIDPLIDYTFKRLYP